LTVMFEVKLDDYALYTGKSFLKVSMHVHVLRELISNETFGDDGILP